MYNFGSLSTPNPAGIPDYDPLTNMSTYNGPLGNGASESGLDSYPVGWATVLSFLFEKYINKIIVPSKKEVSMNNPSRSAKLRIATRSKNKFFYPSNLIKKFTKYLDIEAIHV